MVSTFARQLCAQPHAMPFVHAVRYEPARATTTGDGAGGSKATTTEEERIEISFHYDGVLQRLDLVVARRCASPPAFVCARVDCSRVTSTGPLRAQLQQLCPSSSSCSSAAVAAATTQPGLFSAVESVVRILRAHSQLDPALQRALAISRARRKCDAETPSTHGAPPGHGDARATTRDE